MVAIFFPYVRSGRQRKDKLAAHFRKRRGGAFPLQRDKRERGKKGFSFHIGGGRGASVTPGPPGKKGKGRY